MNATRTVTPKYKKQFNFRAVTDFVSKAVMDVIAETTITIVILGTSLAAIYRVCPPVYISTIPGMYAFAMLVILGIRITRHFDDSYTNNELHDRIVEMDNSTRERLDGIIRNMIP